jgi:hypothetical protein
MWEYDGREFTQDMVGDYVGFVYHIENLQTGRVYIGQKKFGARRKVKSKTARSKRVYKVSDWQRYFGSNADLQKDVELLGEHAFRRKITRLCLSKSEMNYYELYDQMMRHALLRSDSYYNSFVGGKIHRKHLTSLTA